MASGNKEKDAGKNGGVEGVMEGQWENGMEGWRDEGMEIERDGGMNGKMEVWSDRVMEE